MFPGQTYSGRGYYLLPLDIFCRHESVNSSVNADIVPFTAVPGRNSVTHIHKIPFGKLRPGFDIWVIRSRPCTDV